MVAAAALALRIVLIGAERVLLRRLATEAGAAEAAASFFGIGALALLPWAIWQRPADASFLRLALPSGLVYAVAYWLYVQSFRHGEVSAVAPLSATGGVFVVALAALVHHEPLTARRVGGALLVACGAALLQAPRAAGAPAEGRRGRRAAAAMLGYSLLGAVTRMLDKAHAAGPAAAPAPYAFTVFAVVTAAQLALLAASGGIGGLARLVAARPALALAAGLCNAGSFLLLLIALRHLPVSVADPLTSLSLLVSAALAAVWLGERAGARLWPTLAVVAGTWLLAGSATEAPEVGG